METHILTRKILNFWFQGLYYDRDMNDHADKLVRFWFKGSSELDQTIRREFSEYLFIINPDDCSDHFFSYMQESPESCLALIILFDQFPRNIYRSTARAYSFDKYALKLALYAHYNKFYEKVPDLAKIFFYLPFEHSEDIAFQSLSVSRFSEWRLKFNKVNAKIAEKIYKYAEMHFQIIYKFKRFPHRNRSLERATTTEEEEFLSHKKSMFGQKI